MAQLVKMSALMACSFGKTPSSLIVLPVNRTNAEGTPAPNIMDFKPIVNIPPFGMCTVPTNPAVIAALGSPVPCVQLTTDPWIPGSPTVTIGGMPALNSTSKCMCKWLGVISITFAGTVKTNVA